jgi:hypothetical protein
MILVRAARPVTATDEAGNVSVETVTYAVRATAGLFTGPGAIVRDGVEHGVAFLIRDGQIGQARGISGTRVPFGRRSDTP